MQQSHDAILSEP